MRQFKDFCGEDLNEFVFSYQGAKRSFNVVGGKAGASQMKATHPPQSSTKPTTAAQAPKAKAKPGKPTTAAQSPKPNAKTTKTTSAGPGKTKTTGASPGTTKKGPTGGASAGKTKVNQPTGAMKRAMNKMGIGTGGAGGGNKKTKASKPKASASTGQSQSQSQQSQSPPHNAQTPPHSGQQSTQTATGSQTSTQAGGHTFNINVDAGGGKSSSAPKQARTKRAGLFKRAFGPAIHKELQKHLGAFGSLAAHGLGIAGRK